MSCSYEIRHIAEDKNLWADQIGRWGQPANSHLSIRFVSVENTSEEDLFSEDVEHVDCVHTMVSDFPNKNEIVQDQKLNIYDAKRIKN